MTLPEGYEEIGLNTDGLTVGDKLPTEADEEQKDETTSLPSKPAPITVNLAAEDDLLDGDATPEPLDGIAHYAEENWLASTADSDAETHSQLHRLASITF